jgi:uncharacterized protein YuzE
MHVERDVNYNLLYIAFRDKLEKGEVAKTKELTPGVYGDFDVDGYLIGIEIANTERVLGAAAGDLRLSGELLGVKEAAELADKDRANFLRDLASRPDFPKPVAHLASGQLWLSIDVVRYLNEHSRGSENPSGPTGEDDAPREKQIPKIPYRGWEGREGERYRDYQYEEYEQYEDPEMIDTSESIADSNEAMHDDVDHEVHHEDKDSQEAQDSA